MRLTLFTFRQGGILFDGIRHTYRVTSGSRAISKLSTRNGKCMLVQKTLPNNSQIIPQADFESLPESFLIAGRGTSAPATHTAPPSWPGACLSMLNWLRELKERGPKPRAICLRGCSFSKKKSGWNVTTSQVVGGPTRNHLSLVSTGSLNIHTRAPRHWHSKGFREDAVPSPAAASASPVVLPAPAKFFCRVSPKRKSSGQRLGRTTPGPARAWMIWRSENLRLKSPVASGPAIVPLGERSETRKRARATENTR